MTDPYSRSNKRCRRNNCEPLDVRATDRAIAGRMRIVGDDSIREDPDEILDRTELANLNIAVNPNVIAENGVALQI